MLKHPKHFSIWWVLFFFKIFFTPSFFRYTSSSNNWHWVFFPFAVTFKEKSNKGFLLGVNMRNKRPGNKENFMGTHRHGHPSVRSAIHWQAAIFRRRFVSRKLQNAAWEPVLGQEHENLEEVSRRGTHHLKPWSRFFERSNQSVTPPQQPSASWDGSSLKGEFTPGTQILISSPILD